MTEVQKLEEKIRKIKRECKHKRYAVIKGASGVLRFFTIKCHDCDTEVNYCSSDTCVKCLGKMKFVRNGEYVSTGGGGCAGIQEMIYRCEKCGHEYAGGRCVD